MLLANGPSIGSSGAGEAPDVPPPDLGGPRRGPVMVGALLLLAIAAATSVLIVAQRDVALDQTRQSTARLGQVLAEQTSRWMQTTDLALRAIAGRANAADSDAQDPRATFDMLVDELKGLPQVEVLVIVGPDGRLRSNSRAYPAPALDLWDRDYFRHFRDADDHALFVSAPEKSRVTGQWTVFLARRVEGANHAFAGVVAAGIALAYLEDFYRASMPTDGAVTVLRRDGTILVHFPHNERQIGAKLPAEAPWYGMLGENGGSYLSPGYVDKTAFLVSVHPLRDFPLVIDVSASKASALAGWLRRAEWLLAGAVLAAAAAIFLLWVFDRQLRRLMRSEASLARQNVALARSRLQFDATLENVSQGVTFFDRDQVLIVCNQRYRDLYGLTREETRPGARLYDILKLRIAAGYFPDMTLAAYLARRAALVEAGEPFDITDAHRDGRIVAMHYKPLPDGGWVATHEDITERRRAEADLAFMARHDSLTALPNRTLFRERLEQAVAGAHRDVGCAVLCLDLDGFKLVNDTLGHPVGDALLRAVAERLAANVREVDTIARLGGDEFAIIQTGFDNPERAAVLAGRIVQAIGEPFEVDDHRIHVGVSVGIAVAPSDGTCGERLLRNADTALYLAKAEGGGTFRMFEPEMDARMQGRRLLALDLGDALASGAFELLYHPIVDLRSARPVGVEALIRWNHPVRGPVVPADFTLIAEDTGLIVPIGKWVLSTACLQAMTWPCDIGIAVDLSAAQFKGGKLVESVQEALDLSGLAPGRLQLEITESALMQRGDAALAQLHRIRALGVGIALDHFGTGYSSLSHLRSFPFDRIKIDRSFIGDLTTNRNSKAIVTAIIGLASGLGMIVTAEGVEAEGQLHSLRELGCTDAQGDIFSPPLPAARMPMWMRARRGAEADSLEEPRQRDFAAPRLTA